MLEDIDLGNSISIKPCRLDLGLEYPIYKTKLAAKHSFELDEGKIKIPADITGFNAKANGWIVLELLEAPDFLIAAKGDYLAVRRTNKAYNGQIALIRHNDHILIKQIFIIGQGVALRALDFKPDLLILPSALEIRGIIEGLAIEKSWYKIITNEKLPER
ncbi:MAG: S24 family peptidase [Acidobacteria bacterium]|nr:S24 family peptidase [Acidobacteriota bacterium]